MSARTTAEIVADLREWAADCDDPEHDDTPIHREAAALLEELASEVARLRRRQASVVASEAAWDDLDALRLACLTCSGTGEVRGMHHTSPAEPLFDCPDCSDGLMSHARAWKIVAAVFQDWPEDLLPTTILHLRSIR